MLMSFFVEIKKNSFKYSVYKAKNIKLFLHICCSIFFFKPYYKIHERLIRRKIHVLYLKYYSVYKKHFLANDEKLIKQKTKILFDVNERGSLETHSNVSFNHVKHYP